MLIYGNALCAPAKAIENGHEAVVWLAGQIHSMVHDGQGFPFRRELQAISAGAFNGGNFHVGAWHLQKAVFRGDGLNLHGICKGSRALRHRGQQEFPIGHHHFTADKHRIGIAPVQRIHQLHISGKARGNRANILKSGFTGGIPGAAADRIHGIHPRIQQRPQQGVHMTALLHILGMHVVRAYGKEIQIPHALRALDHFLQAEHGGQGRTLHVGVHADAHAFPHILGAKYGMRIHYAGKAVGGHVASRHIGCMPLDHHIPLAAFRQDIPHEGLIGNDCVGIHHFSNAVDARRIQQLRHLRRADREGHGFKFSVGGNAGRSQIKLPHGRALGVLHHPQDSLHAAYVANLMGIGHGAGRSMQHSLPAKALGRKHGGFHMHMDFHKARQQVFSLPVHRRLALRIACLARLHMNNYAVLYIHGGRIDFARQHVYQLYIFYRQIAGNLLGSGGDQRRIISVINSLHSRLPFPHGKS